MMAAAARDDGHIALKLPALIDSTARIATGLATAKTIAAGSIATLTGAVLRAMFIARWFKVAAVYLAVGAAGSGAGMLATLGGSGQELAQAEKAAAADLPALTVRPGKLHAVVSESGIVATENSWSVVNKVEGQSTLLWILPDRSIVKKGDLFGQLDSRRPGRAAQEANRRRQGGRSGLSGTPGSPARSPRSLWSNTEEGIAVQDRADSATRDRLRGPSDNEWPRNCWSLPAE